MSFQVSWHITGSNFNKSIDSFVKSSQKVTSSTFLKEHESEFNKNFKKYIEYNIRRAGMDAENLSDVFALQIDDNNINFVNTEPLITQRYEYGYYDSKDNNEDYYEEYIIQTSPRYFIRPAIQQSMNDIGKIMLEEAKKEYMNNRQWDDIREEPK